MLTLKSTVKGIQYSVFPLVVMSTGIQIFNSTCEVKRYILFFFFNWIDADFKAGEE